MLLFQPDYSGYDEEKVQFLLAQLDLFNAICYVSFRLYSVCSPNGQGRNEYCIRLITKDLSYLSWEEGFLSLQSEILPDDVRAKYCEMIIGGLLINNDFLKHLQVSLLTWVIIIPLWTILKEVLYTNMSEQRIRIKRQHQINTLALL